MARDEIEEGSVVMRMRNFVSVTEDSVRRRRRRREEGSLIQRERERDEKWQLMRAFSKREKKEREKKEVRERERESSQRHIKPNFFIYFFFPNNMKPNFRQQDELFYYKIKYGHQ